MNMTSNVSDLVKVKLLEWEDFWPENPDCQGREYAKPSCGEYYHVNDRGWWLALDALHPCDGKDEAKSAAQADYESRILAALTPAEQCFSVKEGYRVQAQFLKTIYEETGIWVDRPLAEALTIRSAEEVRREFAESLRKACLDTEQGHELLDWVLANCWGIDTPAQSPDTRPSVATPKIPKAIAVKCPICSGSGKKNSATICMHCHGDGKVVALAAQTGGE